MSPGQGGVCGCLCIPASPWGLLAFSRQACLSPPRDVAAVGKVTEKLFGGDGGGQTLPEPGCCSETGSAAAPTVPPAAAAPTEVGWSLLATLLLALGRDVLQNWIYAKSNCTSQHNFALLCPVTF